MRDDVTLKIGGGPGTIDARAFHRALGSLLDLLEDADQVTSEKKHPWTVSTLRESSAVAGIAHPSPGQILQLVDHGLSSLRESAAIPHGWTAKMVSKIRTLGGLVGRSGAESVTLDMPGHARSWDVDGTMTAHATAALRPVEITLGALRGRADTFSERGRRTLGITTDSGETVSATFPVGLRDRIVTEAVGRRGEFWGDLERNGAGQPVGFVVSDFAIESGDRPTMPPSAVRGLLAGTGLTLDLWLESRGE